MSGYEEPLVAAQQEIEQLRQRVAELEQQVEQYASIMYHIPNGLMDVFLLGVARLCPIRMKRRILPVGNGVCMM